MKLRQSQLERKPRPRAIDSTTAYAEQEPLHFDPHNYLSREYIAEIGAKLHENPNNVSVRYLSDLVILFPDRRAELGIDNQFFLQLLQRIKEYSSTHTEQGNKETSRQKQHDWLHILRQTRNLTVLYPEYRDQFRMQADDLPTILQAIEQKNRTNAIKALKAAADLAIACPELRHLYAEQLDKYYDEWRRMIDKTRTSGNYDSYLYYTSKLRLAFPDRAHQTQIDDNDYTNLLISDMIENKKNNEYQWVIEDAITLKIFTANEIKISEHGVELLDQNPINSAHALPPRNIAA